MLCTNKHVQTEDKRDSLFFKYIHYLTIKLKRFKNTLDRLIGQNIEGQITDTQK